MISRRPVRRHRRGKWRWLSAVAFVLAAGGGSFLSRPVTTEEEWPLLAVNPDALAQRDGKAVVFIVRDGRLVEVPVVTGRMLADVMAIEGDVKSGEEALLRPGPDLESGVSVAPANG